MTVEVVPVGRVDAGAQPEPWIGQLELSSAKALRQLGKWPGPHRDALLEAQRPGLVQAPACQPLVEEVVVVVTRDDHDPSIADSGSELVEERACDVDRRP